MSAAHTPGLWVIDPPSMGEINGGEYHTIEAGDGFTKGRYVGFRVSAFMSIADARLIAAAPELLNACRAYDEWADKTYCNDPGLHAIREAMRAAIAKATGSTS